MKRFHLPVKISQIIDQLANKSFKMPEEIDEVYKILIMDTHKRDGLQDAVHISG
jgi:hypothetical protein